MRRKSKRLPLIRPLSSGIKKEMQSNTPITTIADMVWKNLLKVSAELTNANSISALGTTCGHIVTALSKRLLL